MNINKAQV
ncbi:hypothetical protein FWK35_00010963 [Aphis craccivora]|uniref:Uncharacterized protein n=1 Tax=Aphis craccivora TaxID=307492 RepID=A0A6G0Z7R5_APHCR|nr:hypothetical protein FWK35_00010963 [Aphis craccivora]